MKDVKLAHGDELCRVIENVADLEWRKFRGRTLEVTVKSGDVIREDRSTYPPFTSVRFKLENPDLVVKLKEAVDSYRGAIAWHMLGHQRLTLPGTNWVIQPVFVDQVQLEAKERGASNVDRYIAEHYPEFAPVAYADLIALAEHVRKALES